MPLTPITRKENFMARAAGNPGLELQPVTREEHFLKDIADAQGGGSVTPASIVTATGQMTAAQAADTLANLGGEPKKLTVTVTKSNDVYSANKTVAEINTAHTAGHSVIAKYNSLDFILFKNTMGLILEFISITDENAIPILHILYATGGGVDTWSYSEVVATTAPATVTDLSSTSITLAAQSNTEYTYGTLTALTVSSFPASGTFSIVFVSGATATTTTIPATILGLESFAAEANTLYEINVLDNRAVVGSWAVSAS